MLQVNSAHKLQDMEAIVCRAAQRHGSSVLAVTHLGPYLKGDGPKHSHGAIVFTLCHSALYGALLETELRFAAFLPCRIATIERAGGVSLEAIAPKEFCHNLNRPDLERLAAPLETMLREIMEDAARTPAGAVAALHALSGGGPGAREDQVSMRGSLAQRIDCHGTKIEDLAGTGELDAPGG
jgi:uncharacterized protein (DUF302 family)